MLNRKFLDDEMQKIVDLLIRKNTDYGSSFDKAMEKWGGLSFLVRLDDKFGRLESIFDSKQILVEDEGVLDTIDDIIGYCLLYKHYCMTKEISYAGLNEMKDFHDDNYTVGDDKIHVNPDDMIADKKNKIYQHIVDRQEEMRKPDCEKERVIL